MDKFDRRKGFSDKAAKPKFHGLNCSIHSAMSGNQYAKERWLLFF